MDVPATTTPPGDGVELTVDELATRAGLPVRTIREYQTMGLLPSPERRGRVGIYRTAHLARLQLIGRLQDPTAHVDRDLTGLRFDDRTGRFDEVAGIKQRQLTHANLAVFGLERLNGVALQKQLHLTAHVTQDDKSQLAELADTGHTSGDGDFLVFELRKALDDLSCVVGTVILGWVWVDTERTKLFKFA